MPSTPSSASSSIPWGMPRGKRIPVRQFLRGGGFHIANVIYTLGSDLLHLRDALRRRDRRLPRHARRSRPRQLPHCGVDRGCRHRDVRHRPQRHARAGRDGCPDDAQAAAHARSRPRLRRRRGDRARVPLLHRGLDSDLRRHQLLLDLSRLRDGAVHARHPGVPSQDRYRGGGNQRRVRPRADGDQPALRAADGYGRPHHLLQVHSPAGGQATRPERDVHGQAVPARGGQRNARAPVADP